MTNRILVVEDDPDIRGLIVARLGMAGYAVKAVGDGAAALAVCSGDTVPEVLVLDIGLPDVDGFELLDRIRDLPTCIRTPAIFLSARVQEADILRGRAMGAQYLTKPFVARALLDRVREALDASRAVASAW